MPRRKAVERNWWADRWLSALQAPWDGRIGRGRSYAQGGRVHDLQIEPGLVTARVIGTRPTPYRVELKMPTLDDRIWSRAAPLLAERASTTAALLGGELPAEAEDAIIDAGGTLFPTPDERVAASCSCPDWVRPCKHAAALMHVIATEVDRDPFLLFTLRGRTRDELLATIRAERARGVETDPSEPVSSAGIESDPDRFWCFEPPPELAKTSSNGTATEHESVLRRLGQPPRSLGGAELRRELETAYELLAERAREARNLDKRERPLVAGRIEDGAAEG